MVATGIVFFPAAPLFLFMHGKDVTIPKGTEITAYMNGDFPIDAAKFASTAANQAQPATAPAAPPAQVQPTPQAPPSNANGELSTIELKSSPDSADITVDGKYVGSTPSTLKLAPGEHVVALEKAGFKTWQRTVTVGPGGSITINASLQKVQ